MAAFLPRGGKHLQDGWRVENKNTEWHSTILLSNPDFIYDSWYKTHQRSGLNIKLHASGQEFSDAGNCFCLNLPTGNIWNIILLPCLFVQPIAAHDFSINLFDTHTSFYATFEESWCVEHYMQSMIHCSELARGHEVGCHPLSHSWWQLKNMAATRGWLRLVAMRKNLPWPSWDH